MPFPEPRTLNPEPSISPSEIAHFSAQAADWWNPSGGFKPLHRLNPVRIEYLRDRIAAHYGLGREQSVPLPPLREGLGEGEYDPEPTKSPPRQKLRLGKGQAQVFASPPQGREGRLLAGLSLLDVGCGGGLAAEPLARLGARVTGLDASAPAIAVAKAHAATAGLNITYRAGSVEDAARGKQRYDIVTALEIIEHVADRQSFIKALASLVKPGGLLILSTLNRTPKSFMLGIVAAEYALGWVPIGTHDWKKFIRPSELAAEIAAQGLRATDLTGLTFNPLANEFRLSRDDLAVNYFMTAVKTA